MPLALTNTRDIRAKLYRITKVRYLTNLSRQGGSYRDSGCWNKAGQTVLYFGLSAAFVMFEMGNYILYLRLLPKEMVLGIYEVDTTAIKSVEHSDMPEGWDQIPLSRLHTTTRFRLSRYRSESTFTLTRLRP